MEATCIVNSSNGTLEVDTETGEVIVCNLDEAGDATILNIKRFDLEEWKRYHRTEDIPDYVDILDLGYWYKGEDSPLVPSEYEPPADDWRQLISELKKGN